jgi:hypothetical protein
MFDLHPACGNCHWKAKNGDIALAGSYVLNLRRIATYEQIKRPQQY